MRAVLPSPRDIVFGLRPAIDATARHPGIAQLSARRYSSSTSQPPFYYPASSADRPSPYPELDPDIDADPLTFSSDLFPTRSCFLTEWNDAARDAARDDGGWNDKRSASPRRAATPPRRDRSRSRSPPRHSEPEHRGRSNDTGEVNPGNNLHVSGVSNRVRDADLEEAFSKYGRVLKAQVMYDPHSKEPRGFAFVTMEKPEDADAAMAGMTGVEMMGRTLNVTKARRGRARTPTPGRYFGPPKRESEGGYPPRGGPGGYGPPPPGYDRYGPPPPRDPYDRYGPPRSPPRGDPYGGDRYGRGPPRGDYPPPPRDYPPRGYGGGGGRGYSPPPPPRSRYDDVPPPRRYDDIPPPPRSRYDDLPPPRRY